MRSQGSVRFIKVSSRLQKTVAGGVVLALLVWAISMGVMSWMQYRAAADRMSLLEREAQVATASERVDAYRDDLGSVASDLERRQAFIEDMVDGLPSDAKAGETVSDSSSATAETVSKVSAALPEAKALAKLEARQLAFVERLTLYLSLIHI